MKYRMVRLGLLIFASLFAVCLPVRTRAETFDERVDLARQAEKDPTVSYYQKIMIDKVGNDLATFMSNCWGEDKFAQPRKFILVASISHSGQARDIEVQPDTERTRCFANGVSSLVFPTPPAFSRSS
jgi:hypothetical protein